MSTIKWLCISILLISFGSVLDAQTSDWTWAKRAGGTSTDESSSIAVDAQGNSYVTGYYQGTGVFGSTSLANRGVMDVFVTKLDTSGNVLWAARAGGTQTDIATGIAVAPDGFVYVIGFFNSSTMYFGESTAMPLQRTLFNNDVFIAKLSSSGTWVWAKKAGGPVSDIGTAITIGSDSSIYISGTFEANATFPPLGVYYAGANGKYNDIFVAKMNSDGNFQWVATAVGQNNESALKLEVDPTNNGIYVCGYFASNSIYFGSITVQNSSNLGTRDAFIARLESDGAWSWVQKSESTGDETANDLAVDNNGFVYVTGTIQSNTTFSGLPSLSIIGGTDLFACKLSSQYNQGNWLWAQVGGGNAYDAGWGIAADNDFVYLTGEFKSTAYFGDYSATSYTSSTSDILICTLNQMDGSWLSAHAIGGSYNDYGKELTIDQSGGVYWTGNFTGNISFGSIVLTSSGTNQDIFIAKKISSLPTISDVIVNGGVGPLMANFAYDIEWNSSGIGEVCLDYSVDAGVSWLPIATNVIASVHWYEWTAPQINSDFTVVRVRSQNSEISDETDMLITIIAPIQLDSPNGGSDVGYFNNDIIAIKWGVRGTAQVSQVFLYYNVEDGDWIQITVNPIPITAGLDPGYPWDPPDLALENVRIKVSDALNPEIYATSYSTFAIHQPISLLSFNNGAYAAGTTENILWTSLDSEIEQVSLEYSLDGGSTWTQIASDIDADSGSYPWELPNTASNMARLCIKDADNQCTTAISQNQFSIVYPPSAPSMVQLQTNTPGIHDITLHWSSVTTDSNQNPINVSRYEIWYCEDPLGVYQKLSDVTNDLSYCHYGALLYYDQLFYKVIAVKD